MAMVSKNLEFENQAEAALDLGDKNGEKRKNQTFHLKLYRWKMVVIDHKLFNISTFYWVLSNF